MTEENLGQDLGRLFEVGFNAGMLAYVEQNQLKHRFVNCYFYWWKVGLCCGSNL